MVTGNQPVTIAEVYDILVTQSQDLTVYCNAAAPGTQPYALCGLTTCAGVEEYDYLGACKCAPETIDEMYAEDPITATFVMGYTSVFLAKSETFREAVMANYLGQLDDAGVQNLCTALTDGQICKESGLDCDFVSFHTGAQNGVCGDDNWVSTEDKKKAGVRGGHRKLDEWVSNEVEVCMGAPCYKLEGADADSCSLTCLCPISVPGVAATFIDDTEADNAANGECFTQQSVSTAWDPTPAHRGAHRRTPRPARRGPKGSECDCCSGALTC